MLAKPTLANATEALARLAAETRYESLPLKVVESAKLRILDTIGVALAGARHPTTLISRDLARHLGSTPAASILASLERSSAPLAGYVNGIAATAFEFDDITKGAETHLSSSILPGALCVAEELQLSGRDLITGFAVGFEVAARIGIGMAPWLLEKGWHSNGVTGALGVAATAANLLRLDVMQTRMAIGVAASEASGLRKNVGSMGKAFHVGHGVRNGVFAAYLAARGFKVNPNIIEGEGVDGGHDRYGLLDTFNGIGNNQVNKMVQGLGDDWELAQNRTVVRLHPCSTPVGPGIDAIIDLANRHDIKPHEVERIQWETTPVCRALAPYSEPTDSHTAKYCMPYIMVVAMIDRAVTIAQFLDERVRRPDVQNLLSKVSVSIPPDFERHRGHAWGDSGVNWGEARIIVSLTNGRVLTTARSHARGWPEDPADWDDLVNKYKECATDVLSASAIDKSIAIIEALDDVSTVQELIAPLTLGR